MKKYTFKKYGVTVQFPPELDIELSEEGTDDPVYTFLGTQCGINFILENSHYSEKEAEDVFKTCIKKLKVDKSSLDDDDIETPNGGGSFFIGTRTDDSDVLVVIAIIASSVSEQTIVVTATFGCDPNLIGQIVGSIVFSEE
jgi:hypothetical protein